jgi:hypothetical protein
MVLEWKTSSKNFIYKTQRHDSKNVIIIQENGTRYVQIY